MPGYSTRVKKIENKPANFDFGPIAEALHRCYHTFASMSSDGGSDGEPCISVRVLLFGAAAAAVGRSHTLSLPSGAPLSHVRAHLVSRGLDLDACLLTLDDQHIRQSDEAATILPRRRCEVAVLPPVSGG